MTLTFSVKANIDDAVAMIASQFENQIPFATALALTRTAKDVQRELVATMGTFIDRPTPFTLNSIGTTMATKASLTSTVYIKDIQAKYLAWQIAGGTEFPAHRAIVVPVDFPRDQYGNMAPHAVAQLLRRRDCFSGVVNGTAGIWQRNGRRLLLLIAYEPKARYTPRWDFVGIAQRVVAARVLPNFNDALSSAIATAR